MGLEQVEMYMEIEERFDIQVPHEETEHIRTVGQLQEYVCRRVLGVRYRRCETQRKFYQIRRALTRISNLPRWYVRPKTRLDLALPATPALRRQAVRRLQNETGVQLNGDPKELVSVGALARLSAAQAWARRPQSGAIPPGGWTRETIWLELQIILHKQTESEDTPLYFDTRLIEDLDLN